MIYFYIAEGKIIPPSSLREVISQLTRYELSLDVKVEVPPIPVRTPLRFPALSAPFLRLSILFKLVLGPRVEGTPK